MGRLLRFLISHGLAVAIGFAAGIYALPILTAPPSPDDDTLHQAAARAEFTTYFNRDVAGSDALHWGEGAVAIGGDSISLMGKLSPGPDFGLYLSPVPIVDKASFLAHQASMVRVGDVKTFANFVVPMASEIDPAAYRSVVVWCDSFGQFITSATYQ